MSLFGSITDQSQEYIGFLIINLIMALDYINKYDAHISSKNTPRTYVSVINW